MNANRGAMGWRGRRGFTLVEVAVTSLLLAAAMTVTLHVLGWVAAERRAIERRACAIQEVANLMERFEASPWDKLTAESAKALTLSEPARRILPEAELVANVHTSTAEPGSKRLSIRLRWRNRAGTWDAPVRLSAWVYERETHP